MQELKKCGVGKPSALADKPAFEGELSDCLVRRDESFAKAPRGRKGVPGWLEFWEEAGSSWLAVPGEGRGGSWAGKAAGWQPP
jgi:hypothetical protein